MIGAARDVIALKSGDNSYDIFSNLSKVVMPGSASIL